MAWRHLTTKFYMVPKERAANLIGRQHPYSAVESMSDGTIEVRLAHLRFKASDYAIRERVFVSPAMGFVEGILGSKVDVTCQYSCEEAYKMLEGALGSD